MEINHLRACRAPADSAPVAAAGSTGLVNHDFAQPWQNRLEVVPDPDGQSFAGRVVQTVDVIEIMMIESVVQRFER